MRLKLEAVEKSLNDQRHLNSELTDRFGETQRELARVRGVLQDHTALNENLERDQTTYNKNLESLKSKLKDTDAELNKKNANILLIEKSKSESIAQLNEQISLLEASLKCSENAYKTELESILIQEKSKLQKANETIEELTFKLDSQSKSADALEDYKKRAQIALKKV